MKPLSGIKVLDFTNVLAGPYCTMMLANMGADVYKAEKPAGDDSRAYGPFLNGSSLYFLSVNRGKKSIICDAKTAEGKKVFLGLAKQMDILVENLRPGAMDRMGIGYDVLKEINPRLIYVAISGFGHSGPYSSRPSYDMIVQAMGGIMSITGEPGGKPVRVGTSIGDIAAGMFGAFGAVNALYERVLTGTGQKVDVAMLDSQLAILENAIVRYSGTGQTPGPLGLRHPSITPFEAYQTRDSYIIVACGNNNSFRRFCNVVELPELADDPKYETNQGRNLHMDELSGIIQERMLRRGTSEWMEAFLRADVPCGPINTIDKLFEDPQIKARNMLVEIDEPKTGKVTVAGNPVKMSTIQADEEVPALPAPDIGEQTVEILKGLLGYSEEDAKAYLEMFGPAS